MAGRRGPPRNPALFRYDHLHATEAVYLIEAGDRVKVGRGQNVRCRLRELHSTLVKRGMPPGRFDVFYTDDALNAELRCIHALQRIGVNPPGCREFFAAVTFENALSAVRSVIGAPPAMKRTTVYIQSATGITHGEFLACAFPE